MHVKFVFRHKLISIMVKSSKESTPHSEKHENKRKRSDDSGSSSANSDDYRYSSRKSYESSRQHYSRSDKYRNSDESNPQKSKILGVFGLSRFTVGHDLYEEFIHFGK